MAIGICECGCGQSTRIAIYDNPKLGWLKGKPIRFIKHHAHRPAKNPRDRFWNFVNKTKSCWLWIGEIRNGYGKFKLDSRHFVSAHRFAYEDYFGKIPVNMSVLHQCDNPPCVRPDHLFLGTHKDNARDALLKGRMSKVTSITLDNVISIREQYASGMVTQQRLADQFNISRSTISAIVNHRTWVAL